MLDPALTDTPYVTLFCVGLFALSSKEAPRFRNPVHLLSFGFVAYNSILMRGNRELYIRKTIVI
jgi:hypothetical protein